MDSFCSLNERFDRFTLAIGTSVVSVFNGSADKTVFEDDLYVSDRKTTRPVFTDVELRYQALFQQVRTIREQHLELSGLVSVWEELQRDHRHDWLCTMEILELVQGNVRWRELEMQLRAHLDERVKEPTLSKLIADGLQLLNEATKL